MNNVFKLLLPLLALALPSQAQVMFNRDFAPQEGLVAPAEKPYRNEICLNGSWQFQPVALPTDYKKNQGPTPTLTAATPEGWDVTPIRIPSPWNVNAFPDEKGLGGDFRTYPSYPDSWKSVQMGWLRRSFTVPAGWRGQRLILRFGAVAGDTQVLVNGKLVGTHSDIFMPFSLDITDAVRAGGANTLLVGVRKSGLSDVQGKYGRRTYQAGSFWGQAIAGIWQDVFLEARPVVHISDVFVKPLVDKDTLEAQVTIRNDGAAAAKVSLSGAAFPWISAAGKDALSAPEPKWSLGAAPALQTAAQTATVPAGQSVTVTLSSKVGDRLKFWSPDSPNLYGLVCSLKNAAGATADADYTRFGWRQMTFQGNQTLLNGKPIVMKGDSWHFMGIPQMTRRYAYAWYRACKDANLNAVRLHAQPYPPFYLDVADEMGIMVLDESAMWASDGGPKLDDPAYWADSERHMKALVLRDRNHPSVFGWSVSNEVMAIVKNVFRGPTEMHDELVRHFKIWADICRENDPTRPWISADGEDDGEGTMPTYIVHYGGDETLKRAAKSGKPWGVGEAGPAYYGSPTEIARQSGNQRAYLSFEDRMEGVAKISYQSLADQRKYNANYRSVFNLVWYGLKPLNLGMKDTTRAPALTDGIFFGPFVEGKPGVQPERLGPYCTTLNPGYDPSLPLYETWPLFDAIRNAQAEPPLPYQPARPITIDVGKAKNPANGTIKSVRVFEGAQGTLAKALADLGVPVAAPGAVADAALLFVDGAHPPAIEAKATIQKTLDAGGTVFVWGAAPATLSSLNALLPKPLALTDRAASSLVPESSAPLISGISPADLYFAELNPNTLTSMGLDGPFIAQSRVLLKANEVDWTTWNGQGEATKTARVLRSEREAKPSGVALAELPEGKGRIVVNVIPATPQTSQAATLNRTLLANLDLALGDGLAQRNLLDANGTLTGALAAGRFDLPTLKEAVEASFVAPNASDSMVLGKKVKDRSWTPVSATPGGTFDFAPLNGVNAQKFPFTYLSFWLYSPKDLTNLLLDPDLPKVDLISSAAQSTQIWVGAKSVDVTTQGDQNVAASLPLQQGWNHILVKNVVLPGDNSGSSLKLRSTQPDYLTQMQVTLEKP